VRRYYVVASDRLLRWLCWALVAAVIVSAVLNLGITLNILVHPPDVADGMPLVDRLLAFRTFDQQANTIFLISNVATIVVFFVAVLLAAVLRAYAPTATWADIIFAIFLVGGIIGIVAQLVNIGVNQAATYTYCDCGDRDVEVVAQEWALSIGWTVQQWLGVGAATIFGIGAAVTGWVLDNGRVWRWLSLAIGAALLISVVLLLIGRGEIADLVTGITLAILVPAWAILLARGSDRLPRRSEVVA
jgi:hypothetical protein